ncbi:unnamed protein product [Brassica napus]|uniref:(rape) hypothetical protein n=1 Tax=Brassica napus TaxID=3708 RepID=A0A816PJY5_BRANA|nr:unnamed protein product [Brassica napus]
MFNEDGVSPLKETIERSFIRPVPPECLNEGVVFKEGSVVDAYFNNGWWTGVIVVERPDGNLMLIGSAPNGSKAKKQGIGFSLYMIVLELKVLSQHMFTRGKLVEMIRHLLLEIFVQSTV